MQILCPKCRALGLTTDCSQLLEHRDLGGVVTTRDEQPDADAGYELDVTVHFAVPVASGLDLDPHQMASRYRETWLDGGARAVSDLIEAVGDDFDLQVRPAHFL